MFQARVDQHLNMKKVILDTLKNEYLASTLMRFKQDNIHIKKLVIDYKSLCQNNVRYDYSDYTYEHGIIENPWDIVNRFKIKKLTVKYHDGNYEMFKKPLSSASHLEEFELDAGFDKT